MANLTSSDECRYILQGVCVDFGRNSVRMVATNGAAMGIYNPAIVDKVEKHGRVIIPVDWLKRFTFDDKHTEIQFTVKDVKFEAEYRDSNIRSRLIEGNYPNWKTVIPKDKFTPTEHFDFSPFKMRAFVKAAEILSGKSAPQIRIKSHGPLLPFSIFISDPLFYGILMPLNIQDAIPAWIKDE